jgi:nucleoside-diphosphate-sugar epimerase
VRKLPTRRSPPLTVRTRMVRSLTLYAAAYGAERLAMATHSHPPPVVTRYGVKLFGTDNRLVIDKARRELGYVPRVAPREGVRLAGAWYRKQSLAAVPAPAPAR